MGHNIGRPIVVWHKQERERKGGILVRIAEGERVHASPKGFPVWPNFVIMKRELLFLLRSSGVNFINVLRAAFTCTDPKSAKKTVKSSSFFALSGSSIVKAALRMLVKLTPVLRESFSVHFFY